MPKVDFYVLDSADTAARDVFVCSLVDKVLSQNHTVFIATRDAAQTALLDELLWSYPPESFSPHGTTSTAGTSVPVLLSERPESQTETDVYINLRDQPAINHAQQQRILEVVFQDPDVLAVSRKHYKFYQEQGYPLQSHRLSA